MVLITLSSFLSVIVINVYHRNDKKNKVPDWLRKVLWHIVYHIARIHTYEKLKTINVTPILHVSYNQAAVVAQYKVYHIL